MAQERIEEIGITVVIRFWQHKECTSFNPSIAPPVAILPEPSSESPVIIPTRSVRRLKEAAGKTASIGQLRIPVPLLKGPNGAYVMRFPSLPATGLLPACSETNALTAITGTDLTASLASLSPAPSEAAESR